MCLPSKGTYQGGLGLTTGVLENEGKSTKSPDRHEDGNEGLTAEEERLL